MLVILVQNVRQTVTTLDVMMTFIAKHAALVSLVISVTKPAHVTVLATDVTEMEAVTAVLDMEVIPVNPVLKIVVTLVVMNS